MCTYVCNICGNLIRRSSDDLYGSHVCKLDYQGLGRFSGDLNGALQHLLCLKAKPAAPELCRAGAEVGSTFNENNICSKYLQTFC